jgi:hypothetical protein
LFPYPLAAVVAGGRYKNRRGWRHADGKNVKVYLCLVSKFENRQRQPN